MLRSCISHKPCFEQRQSAIRSRNVMIWTLWWPVCDLCLVLLVSEVLGEAGRGFVAGRRCAGRNTCSTLSITSTCTYTQTFPLHGARLLSPAPVCDPTIPEKRPPNHSAPSLPHLCNPSQPQPPEPASPVNREPPPAPPRRPFGLRLSSLFHPTNSSFLWSINSPFKSPLGAPVPYHKHLKKKVFHKPTPEESAAVMTYSWRLTWKLASSWFPRQKASGIT